MAKKRDGRTGGPGDGEDGDLFRRVMADAAPLPKRRRLKPAAETTPETAAETAPEAAPDKTARPAVRRRKPSATPAAMPAVPAARPAPMPAEATRGGGLAGIDRRTTDRLRRGRLAIEARLDLHGSFQDYAHRALNRFIVESAAAGRRVVLVITGKGRVSEGGGVLRRNVPQWLRLSPCAPHVLAALPAQPQHGGSGALYVMLRRKRD